MYYNKQAFRNSKNKDFVESANEEQKISNEEQEEKIPNEEQEEKAPSEDDLWIPEKDNEQSNKFNEEPIYQDKVGKIYQFLKDIFKNEELIREDININKIFKEYINKDNPNYVPINMNPDFIIKNMNILKFKKILELNKHIFKTGSKFDIPKEYERVSILGEIKLNYETKKKKNKQKKKCIGFREYLNKFQKNIYFVIMYIADFSYEIQWVNTLTEEDNIIVGFTNQLFRIKDLERYDESIERNSFKIDYNKSQILNSPKIKIEKKEVLKSPKINYIRSNSEKMQEKKIDNTLDELIQEKENSLFPLLSLKKNNDRISNRIKENDYIKKEFKAYSKLIKQEKKHIDNIRKFHDIVLSRKRKREDKEFSSRLNRTLDEFAFICHELAFQREQEDNNIY